jgi:MYXO-CTERM domain-containing protein
LLVQGSWSTPVTFQAQTGTTPGTWYGIVAGTTAAASIVGAVIAEAEIGISGSTASSSGGLLQVAETLIENSAAGMSVLDALISQVRISGLGGVGIDISGSGSIINTIVDHCATGITTASALAGAALILENCTIDHNGSDGVVVAGATGSSVSLTNDLITNNAGYGLARNPMTSISASYCDVWNNALANYSNVTAGTGSISADPLYTSATDVHLRAGSPAIDTGTSVGAPGQDFDLHPRPQDGDGSNGAQYDLGAYEYTPVAGAGGGAGAAGGPGGAAGVAGSGGQAGSGGAAGSGAADAGGAPATGGAAGSPGAGGGAGVSGAGGGAGVSGGAGRGGSGGGEIAGATGRDAGLDAPPSAGSGGCGCQTGGADPGPLELVLVAVGALLARRRRWTHLRV